jgi:ATP-dependent Lon protease
MDSSQQHPRRRRTPRGNITTRPLANLVTAPGFSESDASIRELPVIPIRNAVILPNTVTPLYIDHERTRRAIEAAMAGDHAILALTQRIEHTDEPTPDELYQIGVEAIIEKSLIMPDGVLSVVLRSTRRARITEFTSTYPYLCATATLHNDSADESTMTYAQMRVVQAHFEQVVKNNPRLGDDALMSVLSQGEPGVMADTIAMAIDMPTPARQQILEIFDPMERLLFIDRLLIRELEILELEGRIHQNVQQEMDRSQREYYLREQIRVIQRELAEHDPALRESLDLRDRIEAAGMPAEVNQRALREIERLESMPSMAPEYTVLRTYLDWLITLPWHTETEDRFDLKEAERILNDHHFGLTKVKDRLLEFIAVRKLAPESRSPILCLVGPPGVGKTSLGRSVAETLGRKFVRVSLGGMRDEAEIRGHRRTYVGALPGRIIQTMKQAGTTNPIFVLDEIDKLASDYRGDPASALLEVLDPEQNHAFSDHYLEVPYSLKRVIFILTANSLQPISAALLDRMEVIELPGYTEQEKLNIATNFLISRQMKDHGLTSNKLDIRSDAVQSIIRDYTNEAGVRNLEREIGSVMRKVARRVAEGKRSKVTVNAAKIADYLGPSRSYAHEIEKRDLVGVALGVAWTSTGGDLTPVEIAVLEGKGQIMLTGHLGDILRESAQAAITFARSRAIELGLASNFHEKHDIHMHLPMGSVPKDGPSAGVPIAMAIISALTGRPVRHDIAMTGEITLRGRVLPVGGIKEKALAAYRYGLTHFALPRRNLADLEELSSEVRAALTFFPLDTLDDALSLALHPAKNSKASALTSTPAVVNASPVLEIDEAARSAERPSPLAATPRTPIVGVGS